MLVNLPDNSSSVESLNMKEWQDGLRALLPNININFGGLPNASSPSNANHSVPTSNTATTDSLNWDSPGSWMDPAIITGNRFSLLQLHWQTIKWVFGTNWFTSGKNKKKSLYAVVSSSFHPQNLKGPEIFVESLGVTEHHLGLCNACPGPLQAVRWISAFL